MAEERDFIMARLAAAHGHISGATEACDAAISLFLYPEEDKDGKERANAIDALLDAAGEISRAAEQAQEILETCNKEELAQGEPESPDEEDGSSGEDEPSED